MTVVPALTSADEVLALQPDGVFLSNGPGDPEPLETQVSNIRALLGRKPVFASASATSCSPRAVGGRTYKLKFGHRGANHPVINKLTNRVEITSHNHGFAVDADSLNLNEVEITHMTSTTIRWKVSGTATIPLSACSTTRKPRPVRTTPITCSTTS